MENRLYCGSGKERYFDNGGSVINVIIDLDTLWLAAKNGDGVFISNTNKKKIRLNVTERRQPDQYGNTHSISVDMWRPEDREEEAPPAQNGLGQSEPNKKPFGEGEDIPF